MFSIVFIVAVSKFNGSLVTSLSFSFFGKISETLVLSPAGIQMLKPSIAPSSATLACTLIDCLISWSTSMGVGAGSSSRLGTSTSISPLSDCTITFSAFALRYSGNCARNLLSITAGGLARTLRPRSVISYSPPWLLLSSSAFRVDQRPSKPGWRTCSVGCEGPVRGLLASIETLWQGFRLRRCCETSRQRQDVGAEALPRQIWGSPSCVRIEKCY